MKDYSGIRAGNLSEAQAAEVLVRAIQGVFREASVPHCLPPSPFPLPPSLRFDQIKGGVDALYNGEVFGLFKVLDQMCADGRLSLVHSSDNGMVYALR